MGVRFSSDSREAFPELSPNHETSVPGIYVIGALAGYPLIKHCLNQGYDVIEHISGVTDLEPADEPLLKARFGDLPPGRSVAGWLEFFSRQRRNPPRLVACADARVHAGGGSSRVSGGRSRLPAR